MSHPRELITARLHEVVSIVGGVVTARRNVLRWPDGTVLPGVSVIEGDEDADEDDKITRTALIPRRVRLVPQIALSLGDDPEAIGTRLNNLEGAIHFAVLSDEQLLALTINSLGIRYLGLRAKFEAGRQLLGQYTMLFQFSYWRDPTIAATP